MLNTAMVKKHESFTNILVSPKIMVSDYGIM